MLKLNLTFYYNNIDVSGSINPRHSNIQSQIHSKIDDVLICLHDRFGKSRNVQKQAEQSI
jgi:hypothetical protein